jgi:hypothetical protein
MKNVRFEAYAGEPQFIVEVEFKTAQKDKEEIDDFLGWRWDNRKLGITKGDLAAWLGNDGDCDADEVEELYYEWCWERGQGKGETDTLLQAKDVAEAQGLTVTEEEVYVPRNSEWLWEVK